MAVPYTKKLIEVALPLEVINAASIKEKSNPFLKGHPRSLHLWWSRKPLAACRAVLFAQLVDDPSSHPDKFPTEAAVTAERKRLFAIIEDLVEWKNSTNEAVLERARAEIAASCGEPLPPVFDPFSGGGSIPLEAQRLGLPAYGSDLNPVAVMIGKAMIEIPPRFKDCAPVHPGREGHFYRHAEGLAEDVRYYGEWMRERTFVRIGHLYPKVDLPEAYGGGQATALAWVWARTVPSPDPAFSDVQVPLVSSFVLSSRKGKEAWVHPVVDRRAKTIRYEVRRGGSAAEIAQARKGTSAGKQQGFHCLISGAALPYDHIRAAGKAGKMGQTLIAIVAEGKHGRAYAPPTSAQEAVAFSAQPTWKPEIRLSKGLGVRVPKYGLETFGDLFTDRQLVALNTFSELVHEARAEIERDALAAGMSADPTPLRGGGTGAKAYAEAVSVYLAFIVDKCSDYWSSICRWHPSSEIIAQTFGRQALPMIWNFAEANPYSFSLANWTAMKDVVWKTMLSSIPASQGTATQQDAQTVPYPEGIVISTDPPYYDNIGYADLSDFFFCWMKPAIKSIYPDLFAVLATPKSEELVAQPHRHGGKGAAEAYFLEGMSQAIANMARQSSDTIPATIYYAFKQKEIAKEGVFSTGWATFLQAVVDAGYAVVGTWPLRTEMPNRLRGMGSNALANSVILVCRKRQDDAAILSRSQFIRALKRELPPAIKTLQAAHIAPADMPQAALGPGMAIFSGCKAVREADDRPMDVKTALQLINWERDAVLGDLHGEYDLETRFAVTWFAQHGYAKGDYGSADNLARAWAISVERVKQAGIVESAVGKVRLLTREELDPEADHPPSVWRACQLLIHALETYGAEVAAALMKRLGPAAGEAKELAYHLYDLCETRRQDAKEASAYSVIISDWNYLTERAARPDTDTTQQADLDI